MPEMMHQFTARIFEIQFPFSRDQQVDQKEKLNKSWHVCDSNLFNT